MEVPSYLYCTVRRYQFTVPELMHGLEGKGGVPVLHIIV